MLVKYCEIVIRGLVIHGPIDNWFFICVFIKRGPGNCGINCVFVDLVIFEVLSPGLVQDNISQVVFHIGQCGFAFLLNLNEVANMITPPSKNDKRLDLGSICTNGLNNDYKLPQISFQ